MQPTLLRRLHPKQPSLSRALGARLGCRDHDETWEQLFTGVVDDSGGAVNDFIVVIPAFTVSELTAAFQIGFLIYLPFLIIDLVVSNILLALGMMMMSPTTVSLPFKLLLFVLIGGWAKLVHGLVLTYGG